MYGLICTILCTVIILIVFGVTGTHYTIAFMNWDIMLLTQNIFGKATLTIGLRKNYCTRYKHNLLTLPVQKAWGMTNEKKIVKTW